ncbi:jasmonate-induced oxygenase 1-like [Carex rostrata]
MDSNCGWPEPVIPVQSISESGTETIPNRYIKPLPDRPCIETNSSPLNIPVIDLSAMSREEMARAVSDASRGWGFLQVVNHGVRPELMRRAREVWRGFFHLPMEEKQRYANSPATYEGYGSRLGVEKGVRLDWGDYYFLHVLPPCLKSHEKWPALPNALRDTTDEYSRELINLCERIMEAMSIGLGLDPTRLQDSFGGRADVGACLRVNYYPKCPQPELTLGLSSHSDPGGMTVLLVDDSVKGLQVRRGSDWVTIDPVRDAFIINVGDQIQVLSNAIYKSVEHRVMVNATDERLSMAFFYNPKADLPLSPIRELVTFDRPALYTPMTFNEYRVYIRQKGPRGKSQVESLKTSR